MSPITSFPQSAGGAEPVSAPATRAGSPQRVSNGYTSTKSNGILSPRKASKRFFRRPTLEKSPSADVANAPGDAKRKHSSTTQPKVEIIYRDSLQSENESEESNISLLKKTFETDGSPRLRPVSTHSGERTPSTISDDCAPSALLGVQGLDMNMNRISTGSCSSHTERVVQEIVLTEQAYVQHLHEIIEVSDVAIQGMTRMCLIPGGHSADVKTLLSHLP